MRPAPRAWWRPLRAPVVGGGDLLPLDRRAVLTDGTAAAVVAADATIEWWCPRLDGDPVLSRLLDGRGGAVRLGLMPAPDAPATEGLLWAGRQRREGRQVVTELVSTEASVDVRDDLTDGVITRLLTVRRGTPWVGWSWAPTATAGTVARAGLAHRRWAGGMSVGRTVVRALVDARGPAELAEGAAVRLEPGDRITLTAAIVGIDGLPVRTRLEVDQHTGRVGERLDRAARDWDRACAEVDHDGPGTHCCAGRSPSCGCPPRRRAGSSAR